METEEFLAPSRPQVPATLPEEAHNSCYGYIAVPTRSSRKETNRTETEGLSRPGNKNAEQKQQTPSIHSSGPPAWFLKLSAAVADVNHTSVLLEVVAEVLHSCCVIPSGHGITATSKRIGVLMCRYLHKLERVRGPLEESHAKSPSTTPLTCERSVYDVCFVLAHLRDARQSHHREDRRDAEETAHCVCTKLFYLNSNSDKIYHSICQQIDKSGNGSTSHPWIKDMRTAVRNVPKSLSCSRTPKEVRHRISPCTVFAYWTIASFKVCIAVANPYQRRIPATMLRLTIYSRIDGWIPLSFASPTLSFRQSLSATPNKMTCDTRRV